MSQIFPTLESSQLLAKWHRLTNYIAATSLYLQDNFWLEKPLEFSHIKPRILGHWGTVPGLNLIYGGLNLLIRETGQSTIFIAGPGHGAPSILANLFLEGTISHYYPEITYDKKGLERVIKSFSWPGGFPSHTYPGLPGSINEGGELGYSLGVAFGAVINKPELMVACVIGDGEAETGALSASWMSNRFWNPVTDGFVLPIVHINGYKISNPTIFGTMTNLELANYFESLGYAPIVIDQDSLEASDIYTEYLKKLELAYNQLQTIRQDYRPGIKSKIPVVLLRTHKGWTGAKYNGNIKLENNNYSHGIPLQRPKTDDDELNLLENWLKSYNIQELITPTNIESKLLEILPKNPKLLMGNNPLSGINPITELKLPNIDNLYVQIDTPGQKSTSELKEFGSLITRLLENSNNRENFLIFSPDESESNNLEDLFDITTKKYLWPTKFWDKDISEVGNMLEILSEQTLQSWMQGFVMTGGYGIMISYEAFLVIITSQIDQYIKFAKQSQGFSWREPRASLNYIATSTLWRQDHNGFTHQNPSLINSLLTKKSSMVDVFFGSDTNTMLAISEKVLPSKSKINLIVAGKTDLGDWLTMEQARRQIDKGIMEWGFISNCGAHEPDIIIGSAGDYQTLETLAGIDWLNQNYPELKIKYLNITSLNCQGLGTSDKPINTQKELEFYFGNEIPVLINFHGYPEALGQLIYGTELSMRTKIIGYNEQGTTTTPFDMQVLNGTSRWHVAKLALETIKKPSKKVPNLIKTLDEKLINHRSYIQKFGDDMDKVKKWKR